MSRERRGGRLGGAVLAAAALALVAGCAPGPGKSAARGRDLFQTCAPCHGPDGAGSRELRAPAIAGLPEWYVAAQLAKFKDNVRGAHPDDMEGHRMRPMARTLYQPGDLEAVAAYVAALKPAPAPPSLAGDRAAGERHYRSVCVACHGPDGSGMAAMKSPPLAGQADWYLLEQLVKFKSGMRGAHRDDVTGAQMRAMAATLRDTTAMRDVVAYIKTLGPTAPGGR